MPRVTVLNANGTLRWTRKVGEEFETISANRADGAIAPDGRVIALWDDPGAGGTRSPQARLFNANGVPIANRFWVSERDQPPPGGTSSFVADEPRVAWRDGGVAVIWRSLNSPDTTTRIVSAKLLDVPFPPFVTSIEDDGGTIVIRWTGGGPTYSVYRRTSLTEAPSTVATGLTDTLFSEFKDFQQAFYHISSP
jgi:hypothetical protein